MKETAAKDDKEQTSQKLKIFRAKANLELPLATKLAMAMGEMGPIAKDGTNQGQGNWQFQSDAAIKTAVRNVLPKYGIVIIPSKIKTVKSYERVTSKKKPVYFYDVVQEFTITDGKDEIKGEMIGTGSDSGDKAVNKAVTLAFKNFEKQLFNVSDKNDPDPDQESLPDTYSRRTKQSPLLYSINVDGKKITMQQLLKGVAEKNKTALEIRDKLAGNDKRMFELAAKEQ